MCTETGKTGGIRNLRSMTKKLIRNFGGLKWKTFSGKGKISTVTEKFWKIGGNLKQGEIASWPQGGCTPPDYSSLSRFM